MVTSRGVVGIGANATYAAVEGGGALDEERRTDTDKAPSVMSRAGTRKE